MIQSEAMEVQTNQFKFYLRPMKLMQHHGKGQHRCYHTQTVHNGAQSRSAPDMKGFPALGLAQRKQEPRQTAAMVAMVMGNNHSVNAPEAPAQLANGSLSALAAVDQDPLPLHPQVTGGQSAIRQGQRTCRCPAYIIPA